MGLKFIMYKNKLHTLNKLDCQYTTGNTFLALCGVKQTI